MKKKPPPGATLIARLKERRMARESEGADENRDSQPVLEVDAQTSEGHESDENTVTLRVDPAQTAGTSLIQKTISIDDLKPSTQDYYALTEEIRLAGRFAAVGLIAQGLRLSVIRNAEIHKEHYTNFEEYCRKEHQMSATYAYRLIRMAEMAEEIAQRTAPTEGKNDPFDAMLHLGHRHLMALLPLDPHEVEDYLTFGIPLADSSERVPIVQATEKQIRQALKKETSKTATEKVWQPKDLLRLAKSLEECAGWLEASTEEIESGNFESAAELVVLSRRFRLACERINRTLDSTAMENHFE